MHDEGEPVKAAPAELTMRYINLNKTEFVTKEWEQVYQLLGDAVF